MSLESCCPELLLREMPDLNMPENAALSGAGLNASFGRSYSTQWTSNPKSRDSSHTSTPRDGTQDADRTLGTRQLWRPSGRASSSVSTESSDGDMASSQHLSTGLQGARDSAIQVFSTGWHSVLPEVKVITPAETIAMRINDGLVTDGLNGFTLSSSPKSAHLSAVSVGAKARRRPQGNMKIFVSVVAYRDKECPATIVDLFRKAAHPERIFVGLITQCDPDTDADCLLDSICNHDATLSAFHENNVREVRMHWREARGPCWARYLAQQLAEDEEYYLQIDSHMRFLQDWDQILIQQLHACPAQDPVLSTYPAGYDRGGPTPDQAPCTVLCASSFGDDQMLRIRGRMLRQRPSAPVPGLFWAAGFSFSYSSLLREVPYDPGLKFLFFGEEVSLLARMWTAGYDVFAPTETVVFHLWTRDYRPSFSTDVRDHFHLRARSLARAASLLGCRVQPQEAPTGAAGKEDLPKHEWSATMHLNCCSLHGLLSGRMRNPYRFDQAEALSPPAEDSSGEVGLRYGLGAKRTLAAFYNHTGVDFADKIIADKGLNGGMQQDSFVL